MVDGYEMEGERRKAKGQRSKEKGIKVQGFNVQWFRFLKLLGFGI